MDENDRLGPRPRGVVFAAELPDTAAPTVGGAYGNTPETQGTTPAPGPFVAPPAPARSLARDGRYRGGNHEVEVELRVDLGGTGLVSADLNRRDIGGGLTYVASLRTAPGIQVQPGSDCIPIAAQDRFDTATTGCLRIDATSDGDTLQGALRFNAALDGLPVGAWVPFSAQYQGEALRRMGLEVDAEQGVDALDGIVHDGRPVSLHSVFLDAGVEFYANGTASRLPEAPEDGWSEKALFDLMQDFGEGIDDREAFALQLLWLSKSRRSGLFGVMFDAEDAFERQSLAVFAGEIRARFSGDLEAMKLIQTTAHEIGHACNLVHRFERAVGRADSTSIMNYDWRYRGGNRREEYWHRFGFRFDADELEFLRHARRPDIIPGGHGFHSARYWADGTGGYSPYVSEQRLSGFALSLLPPDSGTHFAFGQPVLLGLELTNTSGRRVRVPSFVLDQKAGFIEVMIRRVGGGRDDADASDRFQPVAGRCFDLDDNGLVDLAPGATLQDNLNLTFGASGFGFAEPGVYEVRALFVIYDEPNERELITPSTALRIRVGYPKTTEDESDADLLFDPRAGLYFAFAGTDRLRGIEDQLLEVAERRSRPPRRSRKTAAASDAVAPRDPIAANIIRCKAFSANRDYLRYRNGEFERRAADPEVARSYASRLDARALKLFDPVTASTTRAYRQALSGKSK